MSATPVIGLNLGVMDVILRSDAVARLRSVFAKAPA